MIISWKMRTRRTKKLTIATIPFVGVKSLAISPEDDLADVAARLVRALDQGLPTPSQIAAGRLLFLMVRPEASKY